MNTITLEGDWIEITTHTPETNYIHVVDRLNQIMYEGKCVELTHYYGCKGFASNSRRGVKIVLIPHTVTTASFKSEYVSLKEEYTKVLKQYEKLEKKHKKASKYIAELKKKHKNDKETWVALGRTMEKFKQNPPYYVQNGE